MTRERYPVFVDSDTAKRLNIEEHEGRPMSEKGVPLGGEGVFVGFTPETTTYSVSDWDTMTPALRAMVIDTANRQFVQDAKNEYRADIKNGHDRAAEAAEVAELAARAQANDADAIAALVALAMAPKRKRK